MTNEQKYKTAEERFNAFYKKCGSCGVTICDRIKVINCLNNWLALEAEEEKPEPCPFCGGECLTSNAVGGMWRVYCEKDMTCLYSSGTFVTEAEAIAAHNRVARAVRAAKEDAK